MRSWSFSKLMKYEECPYSITIIAPPNSEGAAASRGSAIHTEAEVYLRDQTDQATAPFEGLLELRGQPDLRIEEEWGFDIDWKPCDYNDAWLRMKLDAYVPTADGGRVIDFKTGRRYPIKHVQQAQLYAIGASILFNIDVVQTEFWYVDERPLGVQSWEIKPEKLRGRWHDRAMTLSTDLNPEPKPSIHKCRYCNVRDLCQYRAEN